MPNPSMRVLIQHTATGLFCAGPCRWTGDPEEACAFEHTLDAFRFCKQHLLHNAKILLKFKNSEFDTTLALC